MIDYSNLKEKTVFDFTKNESILNEVLPYIPKGMNKDKFLKDYWEQNPEQLAFSFMDLADLIGDIKLKEEAETQFCDIIEKFFNE